MVARLRVPGGGVVEVADESVGTYTALGWSQEVTKKAGAAEAEQPKETKKSKSSE